MPIFEYQCGNCGKTHEELWLGPIGPNPPCCGKPTCRVLSGVTFKLGGKGWSKDGYENPTKDLPGGQHSGEKFLKEYRAAVADPDNPYKPGDGLKAMGRKNDTFSDL